MPSRRSATAISPSILYLILVLCLYFIAVLLHEDYANEGSISKLFVNHRTDATITDSADAHITSHNPEPVMKDDKTISQPMNHRPSKENIPRHHSVKTRFLHSGISAHYFNEKKGWGLVTNRPIHKYEILLVEDPLIVFPDYDAYMTTMDLAREFDVVVKEEKLKDPEFDTIWNGGGMAIDDTMFNEVVSGLEEIGVSLDSVPGIMDLLKVFTNRFGMLSELKPSAVYSMLSKFNFRLPQNTAVFFGEKMDNFVCVVMATQDIDADVEVGFDYYYDWSDINSIQDPKMLESRVRMAQTLDFDLNDDWIKVTQMLNSNAFTQNDKDEILYQIYKDGIIGKQPGQRIWMANGCVELSDEECARRREVLLFMQNKVFDVVQCRNERIPAWTGKEFAKAVESGNTCRAVS